jgi:hypothetical protein
MLHIERLTVMHLADGKPKFAPQKINADLMGDWRVKCEGDQTGVALHHVRELTRLHQGYLDVSTIFYEA